MASQEVINAQFDGVEAIMATNKSKLDKLQAIWALMYEPDLYGCTDPNASNYCDNCIYSTDTCIYTAPPGSEG